MPIEESVGPLAGLAAEGKIGAIGLSEVSEKTIRRAAKATRIAAVVVELGLFSTKPAAGRTVEACHERELSPYEDLGTRKRAAG